MPTKQTLAALAAVFTLPGTALAAHGPTIENALERAAQVRTGSFQPPGNWTTGAMLPRQDGKINFDPRRSIPSAGPRMLFIGGNGG
jgi:hypothetical protein